MEEYKDSSPYAKTPITEDNFLGYYKHRRILPDSSDLIIVIDTKYEFRPDLLSYDLYGTPNYWWIFTARNLNIIRNPIYDMVAGIEIYAPTKERLNNLR